MKKTPEPSLRRIETEFFDHRNKMIRTNHAMYPERAVLHCIKYMRKNTYGAWVATVHKVDGKLFATVRRNINGKVTIVWGYDYNKDGTDF